MFRKKNKSFVKIKKDAIAKKVMASFLRKGGGAIEGIVLLL